MLFSISGAFVFKAEFIFDKSALIAKLIRTCILFPASVTFARRAVVVTKPVSLGGIIFSTTVMFVF